MRITSNGRYDFSRPENGLLACAAQGNGEKKRYKADPLGRATNDTMKGQDPTYRPGDTSGPASGDAVSLAPLAAARPSTVAKYREALSLYGSTDMTLRAICGHCGVSVTGFRNFLHRYCRKELLARYGMPCTGEHASRVILNGLCRAAHAKYRTAVAACGDRAHIGDSISRIARRYCLNPAGLSQHLRLHYPELLEWRESERRSLGLGGHDGCGMRTESRERYAAAVELLRTTDMTVCEAARKCDVSAGGLNVHIQTYHRDLLRMRKGKRAMGKGTKKPGRVTGNGRRYEPRPSTVAKCRDAVRLYRDTRISITGIAAATEVERCALSAYLHTWHRDAVLARHNRDKITKGSINDND